MLQNVFLSAHFGLWCYNAFGIVGSLANCSVTGEKLLKPEHFIRQRFFRFVFFNALKWFCCAPQTVNHRNALERFPNDHVAQGSSRKRSDKIYGAMFVAEFPSEVSKECNITS